MEIQDIKMRLTMANVIHYYGLKADKQSRLCCPFHEDKTPSLQIYYKTQTAFCFSTNCQTHGRAIDVIDFIMYKEAVTKHEAIKKAVEIIGGENKQSLRQAVGESNDRAMFWKECLPILKME
ncbi:MAG: hypothetical protein IPK61_05510 [Saprospiraceae bacterium]|nr:hypothetical protein [Saprospiraceae bacterium]